MTPPSGRRKPTKKSPASKAPATPKAKTVVFQLHAGEAQSVTIAGDFNDWNSQEQYLKKNPDGTWTISLKLQPGSYHYKFVVDGNWQEDPNNPNRLWVSEGTFNSVIEVA